MPGFRCEIVVEVKPDGGYFATVIEDGGKAYGHGSTQLSAAIAALANSRLQDFTETQHAE